MALIRFLANCNSERLLRIDLLTKSTNLRKYAINDGITTTLSFFLSLLVIFLLNERSIKINNKVIAQIVQWRTWKNSHR